MSKFVIDEMFVLFAAQKRQGRFLFDLTVVSLHNQVICRGDLCNAHSF